MLEKYESNFTWILSSVQTELQLSFTVHERWMVLLYLYGDNVDVQITRSPDRVPFRHVTAPEA